MWVTSSTSCEPPHKARKPVQSSAIIFFGHEVLGNRGCWGAKNQKAARPLGRELVRVRLEKAPRSKAHPFFKWTPISGPICQNWAHIEEAAKTAKFCSWIPKLYSPRMALRQGGVFASRQCRGAFWARVAGFPVTCCPIGSASSWTPARGRPAAAALEKARPRHGSRLGRSG